MQIRIAQTEDGMTIRAFLSSRLSLSTKMLKYLKYRPDGICVDGVRVTVRHILHTGEILTLAISDGESSEKIAAVPLELPILYEDDDLVVPNKPPHMPTHPSRDHFQDTVANALAYRYREQGIHFVFRPVNRLDRDTSGLLLIARNKLAAGRLTASMRNGEIRKTYIAVLEGDYIPDEGVIEKPLRRSAQSIIVREVCSASDAGAEPSVTRYRTLARGGGCSLVLARPLTGRTHQLRVHFASIGHPIVGDDLYGIPNGRFPRQALHAYSLSFPHPSSGETLSLFSPLPTDMKQLVSDLFSTEIEISEFF